MSVYIKGMEMPTSCWRCPLCLMVDPDTYLCIPNGTKFDATFEAIDHIVLDCPLIPVPPHGDLIDRDELLAKQFTDDHDDYVVYADDIDEMPTIIPASKEEQT